MPGPLSGVLVADFSRVLAGPYATMLLADMGAEVVKVESPDGDETRTWTPPDRDGVSTYYLGINRGKRSIALDLRDEGDLALARELARRADVMIQNFKPGGLAKYGLDAATARAANPGLVYASISGFGQREGATVPGYDLMVQAISGLMSLTGDPDGPPFRAGISVFDVMAGNHAVIGILAALRHRDATGEGQEVEVNLLSSALSGLVNHSSAWVGGRRGAVPDGQRPPQRLPLRAAAHGRPRPDRRRAQRPPLPQALRGAGHPRGARRPALRAATPTAPPTGRSCSRSSSSGSPPAAPRSGSSCWSTPGVPCGPINTIDGGFAMAEKFGLEPVDRGGRGRARAADGPAPDHVLRHARRLPAAAARAGRARRRAAEVAGVVSDAARAELRDGAGRVDHGDDHAARARPRARRDGRGRVRRAGVLAGHAGAPDHGADARVRGGAGRAGRPRVHPHRDRHPAHLALGSRLRAGRARRRAARRGLAVPRRHRGHRPVPARGAARRSCRGDDAGWDALALETIRARRAAGEFVPGPRPPRPQGRRPAHAAADADRPRGGLLRPAPASCSRRSAGSTPRCWAARSR